MTQTIQTLPITIEQLLEGYVSKSMGVRDVLVSCWQAAQQDTHNAWLSLLSEAQLERYIAHLESVEPESLPLYGVPFAIKDNIDLVDLPTTAGCEAYRYQPQESAFVVAQLIAAGAVPLGKTNLDQFATGLVGTRSPWGAAKNSFNPDYVSGGSSSGSAVSVALGQVYFSLGTDTAGSGRVPAAFNNLYGLKGTRGALSCSGVVPACKSLDCVTIFARSAQDIEHVFPVACQFDEQDCYSRDVDSDVQPLESFAGLKIGVPTCDHLEFFGNDAYKKQFDLAVEKLTELGAEVVAFDLKPFVEAAKLLYQGPWVAERYAAIESFFKEHRKECLPVIETIIGGAEGLTAVDTFKAIYQLQAYQQQCDALMANVDLVMTPTAGSTYTIDAVNADPITLNSNIGYYTNFMNLLDYTAIAVPAGMTEQGLPFGVTLFTRAFTDTWLIGLAKEWQTHANLPLGATGQSLMPKMDIMVCGAHMQGLSLNQQMQNIGGELKHKVKTAPNYRFYALAGGPPYRPGLVRDDQQGSTIDVEVWTVNQAGVGELLAQIPHPLGLGSVELEDGTWVTGFICEPCATQGATEITQFGSWRAYMASIN
ncbi:allophanate hydrolase [Vibrio sp. CAIM 722]|uniref:Allophanate hydrolase n=1 Tax=Vibrio eleionomae TaxID=2653505 RepID=A0A7X4RUK6_9VIBR|nr:allophanate hydrolase [Vibrio eleionomae]MZI93608.1 allophanate hydrolase [Vibrio eleionomae]